MRSCWKAVTVAMVLQAASAPAAEFSKTTLSRTNTDLIFVEGELAFRDEQKFANLALNSSNAIVIFRSPGGNMLAGIEIGKAIRLKGFSTYVPDSLQCASACALAWLGGRKRLMSETARVGFHAAYTDERGSPIASSVGNALLGAYLNQLGLPNSAIVYISHSPPEGMQWLTFADAQRYGIDVQPLNLISRRPIERTSPAASGEGVHAIIRSRTVAFVELSNLQNEIALSALQSHYAANVNYYGKKRRRDAVIADKRTFFERWPRRRYEVQTGSLEINCVGPSECTSRGLLNWTAVRPGTVSTGAAEFEFGWTFIGDIWRISFETSKVIDRKVTATGASDAPLITGISEADRPTLPSPSAVQDAIRKTLSFCKKSTFKEPFMSRMDVNGDGIKDYVLDYGQLECDGSASAFCGTGGCLTQVFISSPNGSYVKALDENVRDLKFEVINQRPAMILELHGSACGRAGAAQCRVTLFWNGSRFSPAN